MKKLHLLLLFCSLSFAQKMTVPIDKINTNQNTIAFTFDDGPIDGVTQELIALFEEVDGKATFFNIGKKGETNPDLVKLVIENGHEIGNHSVNHHRTSNMQDLEEIACEISCFQETYKEKFNYTPTIYRAPYLDYGQKTSNRSYRIFVKEFLEKHELKAINASVGSKDYKGNMDSKLVYETIKKKVHMGAIVLCHERAHTLKALKKLLPELKEQGYKFVTVSQLLNSTN
ncbi:divergent polysaccharide deacetylase family protein [Flavobacteriaceae bacterium]|nr:divergent polysaccharide deacetylase family protein [Flavobacteriaceae bacterium]